MKKALIVLGVVACVASAHATTTIYLSSSADPYGLTNSAIAFDVTQGAQTDSYDYAVSSYAPNNLPVPTIDPTAGEFAYMWIKFTAVPTGNAQVQGLHMGWTGSVADVSYYILDDVLAPDPHHLRWQGAATAPNYPEFKNNPQILAAVTSDGIKNVAAANPANLYSGTGPADAAQKRVALLGAIRFNAGNYTVDGFLSDLGIKFDPDFPNETVVFQGANIIPEPASLLLIGLAGLALRRR